ncbi:Na+/H+ antiporter [Aureimonas phyllosphaerae]|uniref:CPA1 family monovalent cation:H+ antiporter n=1 Tax=Aureimonas phyllosphaerae TaxID=1166078 RepID=A0A7W6BU66_9HYPH|nr:Na+/H+ antiporter [Aureimonas phyllosphaerae]MBB3936982.1 CPA1 family monovalent cation:H+ antiporter [Aureimonas phyllosphaerae]MBB3960903.1 CPA1 family monovalent cation:H+ antiporter [Aureimonas phyllosphaerae]SFF51472.1 sodium/proton antiporter, CPA1 family [Aureimonas phyllosphaerae]
MHPVELFELIVAMFVAVLVLHYVAQRLSLPPAVALMVGGGTLAFLPGLPQVELDPELVLVVFLPPLLMDGAWFTALAPFRRHLAGIASLAVGAVLFTAAAVALAAKIVVPDLPWAACVALGAIVSPPDAVSARAVLQRVKLPRRLGTLLEGESLLNDATGLVLFRFAVAATLTGTFSLGEALGSFAFLVGGGLLVGGAIGAIWVLLLRRLGDDYLMIAASVLVCWVSYIAGEVLHVSGVIATVTAGLVCGWYQHTIFTASVRLRGVAFWQTLIFLMEAAVFILIGLSLRGVLERVGGIGVVWQDMAVPAAAVIAAMTLARFAYVFAGDAVLKQLKRSGRRAAEPLGARAATVASWAGMRGVVTLAVALSLPETMPERDLMLVIAFAAIIATVLVQGTTLGLVIRWAGLREDERAHPPLDLFAAEAAMLRAQLVAVERRAYSDDGTLLHPRLLDSYRRRATISTEFQGSMDERQESIGAHFDVILAAVAAGRAELIRLHRTQQIDDETMHDLERDLDLEELGAIAARG